MSARQFATLIPPGALGGLDTNGITIEMGALHDPPGDAYLPSSGVLLKFWVDSYCYCVFIRENLARIFHRDVKFYSGR